MSKNDNKIENACEKMCGEYCRFPKEYSCKYGESDEALEIMWAEKCDSCPMMNLWCRK